jgi:transcription-repair coupling factor (superfamily II helicase)
MRLSGLLPLLDTSPTIRQLVDLAGLALPPDRLPDGEGAPILASAQVQAVVRESAKAVVVALLQARAGRPLVVVAPDPVRAQAWVQDVQVWSEAPDRVLYLPAFDAGPWEQLPAVPDTVGARAATMVQLAAIHAGRGGASGPAPVVVTSASGLLQVVASPADFAPRVVQVRPGTTVSMDRLVEQLTSSGYARVGLVEAPGSFSRRGGILDLFPPLADSPVRMEFFGDEVESLRTFDPVTQRSVDPLPMCQLAPATEFPLWHGAAAAASLRALDWSALRPEIREEWEWQVRDLEAGMSFGAIPFYGRYLIEDGGHSASWILDYLSDPLLILDEPEVIVGVIDDLEAHGRERRERLTSTGALPPGFRGAYHDRDAILRLMASVATMHLTYRAPGGLDRPGGTFGGTADWVPERLSDPAPNPAEIVPATGPDESVIVIEEAMPPEVVMAPDTSDAPTAREAKVGAPRENGTTITPAATRTVVALGEFGMAQTFGGRIRDVVEMSRRRLQARQRVVIVTQQAARLAELYADHGLDVVPVESLERTPTRPSLTLVQGQGAEGWVHEELGLTVLTDVEVFGWARPRRTVRRRRYARENLLGELAVGDMVVHVEHGIAQYQGLVRRRVDGGEREFMLLQFQGADKVYVPTDQLDRVERFIGAGDHVPALSKLGGGEWERAKGRVKQSVAVVAQQLIALYAARDEAKAHAFGPDTAWQRELEEAFPFVETPDQLVAIDDVKRDMEREKPMDRLVCGDVGFGKTEVAVRAAFKAVQDGKQVAVLVPTTVLAMQHFQTFSRRMQAFPVKVELLSRFRTAREQGAVVAGLADRSVDLVVGTHRLLSKDIKFGDLGLLIVDEEQRFGVTHKERLKQLRTDVHVLTLTATPIPRTLHQSMVGMRDMSVIETAPEARLPVKTYVTGSDDSLVREAILNEVDRGGQVFVVHNRVQTIQAFARKLSRLVPEVDITIGHGQMEEDQLENVMVEFSQGSHDVLVCTTIIESGLDLPNVNTIIIQDSGMFGLAQLYQLRGRVGRSGQQAYAYLLYEPNRRMTEAAEKRLRSIFEATDLGSGFKIAMKDLEIRGAGNLLGPEQSGFMNSVGFDLYCRLVSEAVEELRGRRVIPTTDLVIDLPLGAHLPDGYVGDPDVKVRLYRRLAALETLDDVAAAATEFGDRFGPMPASVVDLFYLLGVKAKARAKCVRGIETQQGLTTGPEIVLKLSPFVTCDRVALYKAFGSRAVVRMGQVRVPRSTVGEAWRRDLDTVLDCLRVIEVQPASAGVPAGGA